MEFVRQFNIAQTFGQNAHQLWGRETLRCGRWKIMPGIRIYPLAAELAIHGYVIKGESFDVFDHIGLRHIFEGAV